MPAHFADIYKETVGKQEWAKARFDSAQDFWNKLSPSEQAEYMQQEGSTKRREWLNQKSTEKLLEAVGGRRLSEEGPIASRVSGLRANRGPKKS